jgi:5-methylcytosine-specific restriction endonuclease McrA
MVMVSVAEAVAAIIEARQAKPETHHQRAKKFYASRAWRSLRFKILAANAKRNNGICRCELCGRSRRDGAVLHIDHIEPLSKNWERRLDPTNCQVFCDSCNLGKSNRDDTDFRPPEAGEPEPKISNSQIP